MNRIIYIMLAGLLCLLNINKDKTRTFIALISYFIQLIYNLTEICIGNDNIYSIYAFLTFIWTPYMIFLFIYYVYINKTWFFVAFINILLSIKLFLIFWNSLILRLK